MLQTQRRDHNTRPSETSSLMGIGIDVLTLYLILRGCPLSLTEQSVVQVENDFVMAVRRLARSVMLVVVARKVWSGNWVVVKMGEVVVKGGWMSLEKKQASEDLVIGNLSLSGPRC